MRLIDADELLTQIKRWHERLDEEAIMTGNRTICFTWNDALTLIKHAPTVDTVTEGTMKDDVISRQAAIDVLVERRRANGYSNVALVSEFNRSIGYLMRLPSSQPVDAIPIEWIKNRIDHINGIIDERCGMLIAYNEIDKSILNELWILENMLTIWKEEKKNEHD